MTNFPYYTNPVFWPPNNYSKHMYIKTFTKQDLDILGYQFVIHENMNFAEYQMSYGGAAGKAFSAHMPIYIAFFGLINRFPFAVIYQIIEGEVTIIAIMQLNRKPDYWKDRI